jgi:glycyl-tRNA synthetase beta chain
MGQFGEFERLHAVQTMQEVYADGPGRFFSEADQAIKNLAANMPPAQAERAIAEAMNKLAGRRAQFESGTAEFLDFFADRLKVQQREAGVRYDLIDAIFALGSEDDPVRLLARVDALQKFVETSEGADLLAAYKRAANILKKEKWDGAGAQSIAQTGDEDPLVLVEEPVIASAVAESRRSKEPGNCPPEETALVAALDSAEPKAIVAIADEDFTSAMAALATLRGPIDAFFDKVTVNDPEPAVRARRLNLLARFRDAVNAVADFAKVEG